MDTARIDERRRTIEQRNGDPRFSYDESRGDEDAVTIDEVWFGMYGIVFNRCILGVGVIRNRTAHPVDASSGLSTRLRPRDENDREISRTRTRTRTADGRRKTADSSRPKTKATLIVQGGLVVLRIRQSCVTERGPRRVCLCLSCAEFPRLSLHIAHCTPASFETAQ